MDANRQTPDAARARRLGQFKLLGLAAFFMLPVAASYLAYSWWTPEQRSNYGELLSPRPLNDATIAALKGKWVLVQFDSGACDADCERKHYFMRQVRKSQGKDQHRVERLWLVTDAVAPSKNLLKAISGTRIERAASRSLAEQFPAQDALAGHIYVVDPLGNLMMRLPRDPDPKQVIKDLQHLLKTSRIG
jgi:cytochrome oxidase Cu insertion factor (SCO1/SenC/PrrC family)